MLSRLSKASHERATEISTPLRDNKQPHSIIVLTREHIGDLVCTTPALRSLRKLYPTAHIAVEVGERAACVLEHNPHVDEIIVRPDRQGLRGKWKFIRLLRKRRFDLAVILDDCADMSLYVWLGGVPRRAGLVRKKRFSSLLTDGVPYRPDQHEMVDNFRNVVAGLGAKAETSHTEVFPSSEDALQVEKWLGVSDHRSEEVWIGLNPGASAPSNRWTEARFAELGDRLMSHPGVRVLLLGGPGDKEIATRICDGMQARPQVLTGKLTVLQLAEALRRCDALVTGDTGPMHLAIAVGTPVVALFGPATPSESGPMYAPGNLVIRKVTGCSGCTKYVCHEDHRCMNLITASEVEEAVLSLAASRALPALAAL